jgi:hypothetical protein
MMSVMWKSDEVCTPYGQTTIRRFYLAVKLSSGLFFEFFKSYFGPVIVVNDETRGTTRPHKKSTHKQDSSQGIDHDDDEEAEEA